MIVTRGIVLNTLRYSDSSVITRIYTEELGLRPFMVRTGSGKAALAKLVLLQPLGLVQLSFTDDDRKTMRTVRTIEREKMLNAIPFDTVKTCVALFVAEVIARSIGEEEQNEELFAFLREAVILLDETKESVSNFHLKFMLEFSRFLGFYPQVKDVGNRYFDLLEGEFTPFEPIHPYIMEDAVVEGLRQLLPTSMETFHQVKIGSQTRRILLQKLIDYYRLHLHGMKEISAHKVLEEVLG
ncbi:MAG: DNA repair protein RecO [Flavobacteriales bacterium]|nr:DNA repair protein RecO [Flavobacteriales bacterium]